MRTSNKKLIFASLIGILAMLVAACGSSSTGNNGNGNQAYSFTYNQVKPAPKTGGSLISSDWQPQTTTNVLTTSSVADV
ncbi:MAG TPA: hypothetical protein VKB76_13415, partial [Ktedonobacterales bacterium]|nr:hypothetical protein [Ktedonobacterales bacterium]